MRVKKQITLWQNLVTDGSEKKVIYVDDCDVLCIQISGTITGTGTGFSFKGQVSAEAPFVDLAAINLSSLEVESEPIASAGIYEIGVEGLSNVKIEFNGTTSASDAICVYAKACSTGE